MLYQTHAVPFVRDAAKAQPYGHAFLDGLRALGWIEGRNIPIEQRFAEGEEDRLPAIVDEILGMRPDVIVIDGARVVQAFRARGAAIPIVTSVVSDPVGAGFIASFARPGGNITGMAFQDAELISKRAELLKELVPGLVRVALLIDPGARPGAPDSVAGAAERAVHALGLVPHVLDVRHTGDLASALDAARARGDQAVLQVSSRGWVIDLDLEKFFDRVNHDKLMGQIAKRVEDKRLLKLIRAFLNAGERTGQSERGRNSARRTALATAK